MSSWSSLWSSALCTWCQGVAPLVNLLLRRLSKSLFEAAISYPYLRVNILSGRETHIFLCSNTLINENSIFIIHPKYPSYFRIFSKYILWFITWTSSQQQWFRICLRFSVSDFCCRKGEIEVLTRRRLLRHSRRPVTSALETSLKEL
jgi:hypothetical protein